MTEKEKKMITSLTIDMDGVDYVMDGSGGTPGPNTVGTEQLIDGGVEIQDLDPDIEATDEDIDDIFDK